MKEKGISFMPEMVAALDMGWKTQTRRILSVQPEPDPTGRWLYVSSSSDGKDVDTWSYSVVDPKGRSFTERGRETKVVSRFKTPYSVDQVLWVRESFLLEELIVNKKQEVSKGMIVYKGVKTISGKKEFSIAEALDHGKYFKHEPLFTSPRFMPRWASRYDLVVEEVRIQRLLDITEKDAIAEGMIKGPTGWAWRIGDQLEKDLTLGTARNAFLNLVNFIHCGPNWWKYIDYGKREKVPSEANPWVAAYTFRRIK